MLYCYDYCGNECRIGNALLSVVSEIVLEEFESQYCADDFPSLNDDEFEIGDKVFLFFGDPRKIPEVTLTEEKLPFSIASQLFGIIYPDDFIAGETDKGKKIYFLLDDVTQISHLKEQEKLDTESA